jgi:hypothetical protein
VPIVCDDVADIKEIVLKNNNTGNACACTVFVSFGNSKMQSDEEAVPEETTPDEPLVFVASKKKPKFNLPYLGHLRFI